MFLITQFIGLYVINSDPFHITTEIDNGTVTTENPSLSWIQPPEIKQQSDFGFYFGSLIFAFVFAILLFFLLTRFKIDSILRIWFFVVIIISLFITFNAIFPKTTYFAIGAGIISITLAFFKTFKRNIIVHNLTELLIYPGIATIFVPILNFYTIFILLIIISVYDMWAVWHSGIMQKMAKYQMNNLKIFSGFFVPYVSKALQKKFKKIKKGKNEKIKVNLAILGGGDVVFPIITAGVMLKTSMVNLPFGLPSFIGGWIPALFVIAGATIGLGLLFTFSQKKKFYPAMPFISAGIFLSLILYYLIF
jgi:presenilin-like A22 family membrane protease